MTYRRYERCAEQPFSPLLFGEPSGTPSGRAGRREHPTSFSPLLFGEPSGTMTPGSFFRTSSVLSVPYSSGNRVEPSRMAQIGSRLDRATAGSAHDPAWKAMEAPSEDRVSVCPPLSIFEAGLQQPQTAPLSTVSRCRAGRKDGSQFVPRRSSSPHERSIFGSRLPDHVAKLRSGAWDVLPCPAAPAAHPVIRVSSPAVWPLTRRWRACPRATTPPGPGSAAGAPADPGR